MKLIYSEQLLAQLHVTMQQGQTFVDRIYQIGVDFLRNVVTIERHLQHGRVLAYTGIEDVLVHVGA
ncbi:hypothetical protein D1872_301100 [compost metagenome]